MPEPAFLTTTTTQWNNHMLATPPKWTTSGDGFNLDFGVHDVVPLEFIDHLAANVSKSRCIQTGEEVAVKRIQTHSNHQINEKLVNEVNVLHNLKHYHCLMVLGCYTKEDWFNIVTQPVADCDLSEYLSFWKDSKKVKRTESACGPRATFLPKIMGCLANTLYYIHNKETRVRHRDIKPENILLCGSRVLLADFGLAKEVTETQSGSSGPSAKTPMYTSPERAAELGRGRKDDIFSLGCVFSDIFTAYKGKSMEKFRDYRKAKDPENNKEGYFHRTVPAVIAWLEDLATERCDVQITRLIRAMLDKPDRRPDAEHVWKSLTTFTTRERTFFCSPCCMPLVHNDPILASNPKMNPSAAKYDSDLSTTKAIHGSTDLFFRKQYSKDQHLDLRWVRNLRLWERSILDVVQDGNHPNLLARKRLQALNNVDLDASIYAKNEAEILRNVEHRHIVKLHDTYLQGDIHTLLFAPAANQDLRSYLELAELKNQKNQTSQKDTNFLTRSFGCLTNALACLHKAGYDHNDIRPENILVHDLIHENRIFLSKFSFGLKSKTGTSASGTNASQLWRFIDIITGKLSLRRTAQNEPIPKSKCEKNPMGIYRPPELEPTSVGQPTADVFALGCIFFEMCTVLCGETVREFEAFRADSMGDIAYCNTLPEAFEWLSQLDMEGFEGKAKLHDIIKCMTHPDAQRRPSALEVSQTLRQCKNKSGISFIGDCAA